MIPMDSTIAGILQTAIRSPRCWGFLQLPVVTNAVNGSIDPSLLGSQIVLDTILSCRTMKVLEAGSDSCDLTFSNQNGIYSPLLSSNSAGLYCQPGRLDQKLQLYSGIKDSAGDVTAVPEGVFLLQSFNQNVEGGSNIATMNCLDQFMMFQQEVYTQFPPRLYGNQTSSFFNPAYALTNPSGDGMTWVCDAVNWMTDTTQAPYYASDFTPVTVYVGTLSAPSSDPSTLTYTVNYPLGQVVFSSPIASNSVVSVDARPLGMAPELMLKHLFQDYGAFSPSFFKFDNSGIILPIMDNTSGQTILDVAKQIAFCTNPRGQRWQIFFDELGYLNFTELSLDGPPVATLFDTRDLLKVPSEYTSQHIQNVVRAQITAINQQPIEVISYDTNSINIYGQKSTYDVPAQMIATARGMDPGSAVGFLSSVASSLLFANSNPVLTAEIEILYNPLYQVGDVVRVRESKSGINRDFYINQITKQFDGENIIQSLRIEEVKRSQDFNVGLSGYAGAPIPLSSNLTQGQTNLLSDITIAGTQVLSSGVPILDNLQQPIIPSWDGGSLGIDIGIVAPPSGGHIYIWRWIVGAEDAYVISGSTPVLATRNGNSLNGGGIFPGNSSSPSAAVATDLTGVANGLYNKSTQPADFRWAFDTANSRRYFHPLLRPSDWLTNDGVTGYTTAQTLSSTWSQGPGITSSAIQFYGELRVGISDYFANTSTGFVGKALYDAGTPGATNLGVSSTVKFGCDFGAQTYNGSMVYGIVRQQTVFYLGILVCSDTGIVQMKRIPFYLNI